MNATKVHRENPASINRSIEISRNGMKAMEIYRNIPISRYNIFFAQPPSDKRNEHHWVSSEIEHRLVES